MERATGIEPALSKLEPTRRVTLTDPLDALVSSAELERPRGIEPP